MVITGAGGNFCSGGDVHEIIGPLTKMDDAGPARVHPHDRRPGPGDARLPAADHRRGRRRLRRRRRDPGHGQRPPPRRARREDRLPVHPRRPVPAPTWAPARSCRGSSATAAPPNCCSPAASMSADEGLAWGFYNRARRRRPLADAQALAARPRRRPDLRPRHDQAPARRRMGRDRSTPRSTWRREAQAICMADQRLPPRLRSLRRQAHAGVQG